MALKPLKPCHKPGCPNLTRDGYCPAHKPAKAARGESQAWHWMYNTRLWREDLRPAQLLREPFCRECARRGCRTPATVVDHIRPHKGDWVLFRDASNHQSLCKHCHDAKTMGELNEQLRKMGEI